MAISVTASTAGAGVQDSGTGSSRSVTITVGGADITAGDLIIVGLAFDNMGGSGAAPDMTVTDSASNTYTQQLVQNQTPGSSANDGATAFLYSAVSASTLTSGVGTITATGTAINQFNTQSRAARYIVVRGASTTPYSTSGVSGSGTTYNSGNTATASLASGDLVVGVVASESNTVPTNDTDTTNGSWNGGTQNVGGTGSDASKMSILLSYKIVTASGTQTFNGTVANSDWAVGWALYAPVDFVAKRYNINQSVARAATR